MITCHTDWLCFTSYHLVDTGSNVIIVFSLQMPIPVVLIDCVLGAVVLMTQDPM